MAIKKVEKPEDNWDDAGFEKDTPMREFHYLCYTIDRLYNAETMLKAVRKRFFERAGFYPAKIFIYKNYIFAGPFSRITPEPLEEEFKGKPDAIQIGETKEIPMDAPS